MSDHGLAQYREKLDDFIQDTREHAGELTIEVKAKAILQVCKTLKESFGFSYLSDMTAVDYYTDDLRFGVSYNIVNLDEGKRLRITARVDEKDPVVDSVVSVWTAANWYEREAFDMMGIRFHGNPDMRRIYMPEDFEYYPLRKEFPLIGIPGSIQLPDKGPEKEYK